MNSWRRLQRLHRFAKVLPVALPVLVMTTAVAAGLAVAWKSDRLNAAVEPVTRHLPAADPGRAAPVTTPEAQDLADAQLDATAVLTAGVTTATQPAQAAPPPDATGLEAAAGDGEMIVDYARLNQDVHVVADTLERFNQKLLRMIAQARAAQLRAQAQAAAQGQEVPGVPGVPGAPGAPGAPGIQPAAAPPGQSEPTR